MSKKFDKFNKKFTETLDNVGEVSGKITALLTVLSGTGIAIGALKKHIDRVRKKHGMIHGMVEAKTSDQKGFLVWDSKTIYKTTSHRITFDYMDGKDEKMKVFFESKSKDETELRWKELVDKYGL